MVVQNSVTFSVTRIGSQVDRSKALNYIRTGQHLMLSSSKIARHMSSVPSLKFAQKHQGPDISA